MEKINILLSSRIVGLLVGERLRIFAVEEILLPISICLLQAFDESTRNLHLKGYHASWRYANVNPPVSPTKKRFVISKEKN